MTPGWILDVFAALMLAVAAASAARLVAARPWQRGSVLTDTDIAHLLMAIAMAGMLVSALSTLPNGVWEVIFALMTAWFAYRVIQDARSSGVRALAGGHCAPHLVHSAAMLYMFLALAAPAAGGSGMSGMGGSSGSGMQSLDVPTLAFAFAIVLAGYTVWDLDQISARSRRSLAGAGFGLPAAALAGASASGIRTGSAAFSGTAGGGADSGIPSATADRGVPDPGGAAPAAPSGARGVLLSPGTTIACRIAMGATMALMLLIMI
jgi:Domain of unknown function (DUF5134)